MTTVRPAHRQFAAGDAADAVRSTCDDGDTRSRSVSGSARKSEQRLAHADDAAVPQRRSHSATPRRREHDHGRTMLEPAHLLPFMQAARRTQWCLGRDTSNAAARPESAAHARDQDRRHRHQRDELATRYQAAADHGALVLAEQFLDPLECDRIHVPGVPGY